MRRIIDSVEEWVPLPRLVNGWRREEESFIQLAGGGGISGTLVLKALVMILSSLNLTDSHFVDLGSGFGRVLKVALVLGARSVGGIDQIYNNPHNFDQMNLQMGRLVRQLGVEEDKVEGLFNIVAGDFEQVRRNLI